MATFNINTIDGKMSGQFNAPSAREAGLAAMNQWKPTVALEVQRVQSGPPPTKARKQYQCDCCGTDINKGDNYFKVSRSIGNPNKDTYDGVGITHHGFRYTAQVCVNCK